MHLRRLTLLSACLSAVTSQSILYRYENGLGSICQCPSSQSLIVPSRPTNAAGGSVPSSNSGSSVGGSAAGLPGQGSTNAGSTGIQAQPQVIASSGLVAVAGQPNVFANVITTVQISVVVVTSVSIGSTIVSGLTSPLFSTVFSTATVTSTRTVTTTVLASGGAGVAPVQSSTTSNTPQYLNTTTSQSQASSPIQSSTTVNGVGVNAAFCAALFGTDTVTQSVQNTAINVITSTALTTTTISITLSTSTSITSTTDAGITATTTSTADAITTTIAAQNTNIIVSSTTFTTITGSRLDNLIPTAAAITANYCAQEDGFCDFTSEQTVYFGIGFSTFTSLVSLVTTGPIDCYYEYFSSDPAPGIGKTCFVGTVATLFTTNEVPLRKRQASATNTVDLAAQSAACSQIYTRPTATVLQTASLTLDTTSSTASTSQSVIIVSITSTETIIVTTGSSTTTTTTPISNSQLPDTTTTTTSVQSTGILSTTTTTVSAVLNTPLVLTQQTPCPAGASFVLVSHNAQANSFGSGRGANSPGGTFGYVSRNFNNDGRDIRPYDAEDAATTFRIDPFSGHLVAVSPNDQGTVDNYIASVPSLDTCSPIAFVDPVTTTTGLLVCTLEQPGNVVRCTVPGQVNNGFLGPLGNDNIRYLVTGCGAAPNGADDITLQAICM